MTPVVRELSVGQVATKEEYHSRDKWLEARRTGIGGSDAAAVWGVSKYESPFSLYVSKVSGHVSEQELEHLEIGTEIEEFVSHMYTKRTGARITDPGRTSIFRSSEHPFMFVSLDRLIVEHPERGLDLGVLECKNRGAFTAREWNDGIPIDVMAQVQHALGVTGIKWAAVGVLLGGCEFRPIEIERDEEFIGMHIEKCRAFWELIQNETPPEVDGSRFTTDAIKELYSTGEGRVALAAELEIVDRKLQRAKALRKRLDEIEASCANQIRSAIGEKAAGYLPNGVLYQLTDVKETLIKEHKKAAYRRMTRKQTPLRFNKGNTNGE